MITGQPDSSGSVSLPSYSIEARVAQTHSLLNSAGTPIRVSTLAIYVQYSSIRCPIERAGVDLAIWCPTPWFNAVSDMIKRNWGL
jgi:hypothetical protein